MQARSLAIDPVDRQHALTKAVGMEANILDKIRQLSIIDAKKHIVHRNTLAWLITNGYIPQGSDYVMANGVPILGFKAGDFYIESRHWEKTQERFPKII